jgi:DNA-binding MarR family transcriptional regulator
MDADFDEFLHVPARLAIISLLAPASWVEFGFLRDAIETSDSALSKQVSALAAEGYVAVRKTQGRPRRTHVRLTPHGREAFRRHAAALERIAAVARTAAEHPLDHDD